MTKYMNTLLRIFEILSRRVSGFSVGELLELENEIKSRYCVPQDSNWLPAYLYNADITVSSFYSLAFISRVIFPNKKNHSHVYTEITHMANDSFILCALCVSKK